MPFDSCPLIKPFFIFTPPGNSAPTFATITFRPVLTLGAPQTMLSTSSPILTSQRCKWSESGCIWQVKTSPTTKFVAFTRLVASSYSFPTAVIFSANSLTSIFSSIST